MEGIKSGFSGKVMFVGELTRPVNWVCFYLYIIHSILYTLLRFFFEKAFGMLTCTNVDLSCTSSKNHSTN